MMIMTSALLCLSLNIYHEARSESLAGQYAVAQVTMNRAERDPQKVCEVVTKPKQFSWTSSLVRRKNGKAFLVKRGIPRDEKAWRLAQQIAELTLRGQIQDFTKGATHYHTKKVAPVWNRKLRPVMTIGEHRFYANT